MRSTAMRPSSWLSYPERFYAKRTRGLDCQRCRGRAASTILIRIRGTGAFAGSAARASPRSLTRILCGRGIGLSGLIGSPRKDHNCPTRPQSEAKASLYATIWGTPAVGRHPRGVALGCWETIRSAWDSPCRPHRAGKDWFWALRGIDFL